MLTEFKLPTIAGNNARMGEDFSEEGCNDALWTNLDSVGVSSLGLLLSMSYDVARAKPLTSEESELYYTMGVRMSTDLVFMICRQKPSTRSPRG